MSLRTLCDNRTRARACVCVCILQETYRDFMYSLFSIALLQSSLKLTWRPRQPRAIVNLNDILFFLFSLILYIYIYIYSLDSTDNIHIG